MFSLRVEAEKREISTLMSPLAGKHGGWDQTLFTTYSYFLDNPTHIPVIKYFVPIFSLSNTNFPGL